MIELVDSHCHIQSIGPLKGEKTTTELWSKLGHDDLSKVINEADNAGVTRLILVGCDPNDSSLAVKVANDYDQLWASVGIHPHEAKKYASKTHQLAEFSLLATKEKVVAIGECGLDYYYDLSDHSSQARVLEFQLDLATKQRLPVIFHVRSAFSDFWPIFDNFPGLRGVLHSFTDDQKNLEQAIKRGLMIGINGIATFTKDSSQKATYQAIPLSNMLLETDSPFLTPAPFRGSINQPKTKNVRLVAEYLADLRGESLEKIASQTTKNARQLFSI